MFLLQEDNTDSPKVENGQIVIEREISDGTIHRGGNGTALAGGYTSGMQKDVIRVNLSQMGSVLKNPKDLFSEWTNNDYNAVDSNLRTASTNLYNSATKDSTAINVGITDSVKRGEQFLNLAMGRAESAIKQEELVKDLAIAYLTGGAAGIKSMVKDKIRDGLIDKAAEATGMDPQLVRFALGRFEQGQAAKKVAANRVSTTVAGVAAVGVSAMLPMAAPMLGPIMSRVGGTVAQSLLSTAVASSGTIGVMGARTVIAANTYNNPLTQAVVGLGGAVTGSSGLVQSSNRLNDLKQQERGLIQDAVGATVASAMGLPPDAAGNISQVLGGIAKRKEQKRNNARVDRVVSSGLATVTNMASGMVKGIVKNAIVAVGGSGRTFDQVTSSPFSAVPSWTGAAPVDTSKAGLINRVQEMAFAQLLEANGMDADIAKTVASTTNGKIKAKKAKKEERINAIESTVQTAIAVAGAAITAGAATPLLTALNTSQTVAQAVVSVTSIATQTAIGSRTGGASGAIAGAVNGILQSAAGGLLSQAGTAVGMSEAAITNIARAETYLRGINVSFDREDGFGIQANVTGVVRAIGVPNGALNNVMRNFTNVTIGQSQRGGSTLSLGMNTGIGNVSVNYSGRDGRVDGSVNLIERDYGGMTMSSELNFGRDGVTVTGDMDLGNGYGLGLETGPTGVTGSATILGSQQGTVDQSGVYTANQNFLSEINGQDVVDLAKTVKDREEADNRDQPAKSAKDAKDAEDAATAEEPEDGPSGLVDLGFAVVGTMITAGAAFVAGGGSSSVPAGGSSAPSGGNAGNANTAVRPPRKDEDNPDPKKDKDSKDGDGKKPVDKKDDDLTKNGFHIDEKGDVWVKRDDPLYGGERVMRASETEANMIREGATIELVKDRKGEGLWKLSEHEGKKQPELSPKEKAEQERIKKKEEDRIKKEEEFKKNEKLMKEHSYYTESEIKELFKKNNGTELQQSANSNSKMMESLNDYHSKIKEQVAEFIRTDDPSKLTLITDPTKAQQFAKMSMEDLASNICNINGMKLVLNELPIMSESEKPNLAQFYTSGINNREGVTDKVGDGDQRISTGRFVFADPSTLLIPYIGKKGYKVEGFDIPKGGAADVIKQFLASDQRVAVLKDNGHKWGIVKVPVDPADPEKGLKAVLYDPNNPGLNGKDWERTDHHDNPKRAYWVVPDTAPKK